jgi:hypothetical protein
MTNGSNMGTFQKKKNSAVPEIGDHWMENYCHIKGWRGKGSFLLAVYM